MKGFVAALTLLTLPSIGLCGPSAPAQSACSVSPGAIHAGHYRNEALGLTYTYPNSLLPSDPATLPHDPKSRFVVLAAFWKSPRDLAEPDVFISADDPAQYADPSALAYLQRIQNTVSDKYQGHILQSGKIYPLSGQDFYRLDYQFSQAKPPVFKAALTGRVGACEVTFQITGKSAADVDQLFRSVAAATIAPRETSDASH